MVSGERVCVAVWFDARYLYNKAKFKIQAAATAPV
jgi:hypothetical protein